jgi:acyl-CoA synthetase (AMP-forming)/AMP-acid ligase II
VTTGEAFRGAAAQLRDNAVAWGGRTVVEYVSYAADVEGRPVTLTLAQLHARAGALAAEIRRCTQPGDPVVILQESGVEFAVAFFACLYAGVLATPLYAPGPYRSNGRLDAVVRDAGPALILTPSRHRRAVRGWLEASPAPSTRVLLTDNVAPAAGTEVQVPDAGADDAALLQYTSGSTGAPAAVVITHGNLVANVGQIRAALAVEPDVTLVNWLPLHHDMGLMAMVVLPVLLGVRSVQLAPIAFLQRPRRWLEQISRFPKVGSMAPNFGYRHCVDRIPAPRRSGLDLRGWRTAGNGSEPVRAQTLDEFADAFGGSGFDPAAFRPCYGLAEATVLVSAGGCGPPRRLRLSRTALSRGDVTPSTADAGDAPATTEAVLVSCGTPVQRQEVCVVDPATGTACPPGRVGELYVRGPNVAAGYFRRPERTAAVLRAELGDRPGPWLRTGDLGFLDGGEVFVAGRLKDLIIVDGRNHYPADLEQTAEQAHPAVVPAGVAAVPVEVAGREAVVVVAEVDHRHAGFVPDRVIGVVRRAIATRHEVPVHDVVLVRRGAVPRTTSGKIQRGQCREMYLDGRLTPAPPIGAAR